MSSVAGAKPGEELDQLCVNTIRFLAVDAVQQAKSGHPGMPMGTAPMAYVLWTRFLKHNPANPAWFDRDRFVLSAGHGSMLLYSLLHLTGYDMPLEQIKRFRQWESMTPGHPEKSAAPGIEVTTGPLGQGFGDSVGMAIAEAHLAARFNRPGLEVVGHYTYVLAGDGDLMEGISSETASIAGHLRLGRLICLYDDNRITLSESTDASYTEDRAERFAAHGWHTQTLKDGNDLAAIDRAIRAARDETDRPSIILVRTHIGYGAPTRQDTFQAHGSPLGDEEVRLAKQNLGWPLDPPFLIPPQVLERFRKALDRGKHAEDQWKERMASYAKAFPDRARELERAVKDELPPGWSSGLPQFPADERGVATRVAGGKVLGVLAERIPWIIGGSADLNPSTHTALTGQGDLESPKLENVDPQGSAGGGWSYSGRNLHFGVREHAMGTILNGLAVHGGVRPFGATFLIFSDYMRPPIRLAAMMKLPVLYVFTHDSIGLGEDGPTHQPVEQLPGLRAIPGLIVIRPSDANETVVAFRMAMEIQDHPVALVLSRQKLPVLDRARFAPADGLVRGAYVLADSGGDPELILIASGSEVALAVAAREKLFAESVRTRVISMPSWELFEAQPEKYRESVLPRPVTSRLAIEAASPFGWHRWVGDSGDVLGVEQFGASAPGSVVLRERGFTVENVCHRARALLERARRR